MSDLQENESAQEEPSMAKKTLSEQGPSDKDDVPKDFAESEEEEREEEKQKNEAETDNYKDQYYYLAAEMDNLRKRHEREKEGLLRYGTEKIVKDLLEVIDGLQRGLEAVSIDDNSDEKLKNIYTGMEMIYNQLLDVLKGHGVSPIESLGQIFDPNFHDAVGQQEAEGKKDGEIILEYQKGHLLNGRLIRPSKVVIVNNKNTKKGE